MIAPPAVARLTQVRLKSFKSFKDAVLPIDVFTLLVGRNGSGKSNALDGLWVLSRLASGDDIREALDGGREGPEVRGGAIGCAPPGETAFTLGCQVIASNGAVLNLEVSVQTEPVVQIVHERLWTERTRGIKRGEDRDLLRTDAADPHRSDIVARWDNQKRGTNPSVDFRASQLLVTQVATRVPATSAAGREIHDYANEIVASLRAVFVLDPVPHEMRQYVRRKDDRLRRSADNLSAAVGKILDDRKSYLKILELIRGLSESDVIDINLVESQLDDVMLTFRERRGKEHSWSVPARQMSDGTLRFLALVAALFEAPSGWLGQSLLQDAAASQTTLVFEVIENGLHPSQAERVIALLREEASARAVRVLATTHSPALLDALPGELHNSVIVCWRDDQGISSLCRLPRLNSYLDIVTSGSLGDAATSDALRAKPQDQTDPRRALERLFATNG